MEARVPCFGGNGHGSRGKVLYLFQMEIQAFGDDGKFSHILLLASGMATDEIRDKLLTQSFFTVDSVEYLLELTELAERRFAHDVEHAVRGMLRSHFQTAADMAGDELAGIFLRTFVGVRILALVQ